MAAMQQLYAVQLIPGKGRGMVATCHIAKGTRILAEEPLFKINRHSRDTNAIVETIAREMAGLSKDLQREFLSLHNTHVGGLHPFLEIAKTNVLPLGPDSPVGGLFLTASRINHACNHNSQNTWNANLGKLTIHAFKDIGEGDEVTISYLAGSEGYETRQSKLLSSFGFTCTCQLCTLPVSERHRSDRRLEKISDIDNQIGDGFKIVQNPEACLHTAHRLLKLLNDESIDDARVPRLYYDAMQIVIANGDQARAKVFAEKAYSARLVLEGEDSPETARLKGYMKHPASHRLYGTSMRWRQPSSRVPAGLAGSEYESWLWRTQSLS